MTSGLYSVPQNSVNQRPTMALFRSSLDALPAAGVSARAVIVAASAAAAAVPFWSIARRVMDLVIGKHSACDIAESSVLPT
jgi:hypothetical protein